MSNIHSQATVEVRWTTRDVDASATLTNARVEVEPIIQESDVYGNDLVSVKNTDQVVGATITITGYFTPNGGITMTANQALVEATTRTLNAHREERIRRHVNDTAALLAYRHGLDVPLGLVRELTAYFTAVEDEPQPNPDNEPGFPATWEVRPRG